LAAVKLPGLKVCYLSVLSDRVRRLQTSPQTDYTNPKSLAYNLQTFCNCVVILQIMVCLEANFFAAVLLQNVWWSMGRSGSRLQAFLRNQNLVVYYAVSKSLRAYHQTFKKCGGIFQLTTRLSIRPILQCVKVNPPPLQDPHVTMVT
jgi:hypothetical protein